MINYQFKIHMARNIGKQWKKRTSEPLLYSWCLPVSVCETAVQQPKNGQTCSFFHCMNIAYKNAQMVFRLLNRLPVLEPGRPDQQSHCRPANVFALAHLLHLLVVERLDVALPHLHDVVADLAVETLYRVTRQLESYILLQSIWGIPLA